MFLHVSESAFRTIQILVDPPIPSQAPLEGCGSTHILHMTCIWIIGLLYSPFLPELHSFPLLSYPESAFRTFPDPPIAIPSRGCDVLAIMTGFKAQGVSSHQNVSKV